MWIYFLICYAVLGMSQAACPNGFTSHGNSCYMIFHVKATWSEANFYCTLLQSSLVSINDDKEQTYISNLLGRLGPGALSTDEVWFGGSNLFSSNWQWAGSEKAAVTYTAWAPNEPSNNVQQRCLAAGLQSQFKWKAEDCEKRRDFICESQF